MTTLNIDDIMRILPHRYPFLLIDRITKLDPEPKGDSWAGRKVEAIKLVTINEPFFTGHFPGKPIMPGVLIVEAMAQAAALCGNRAKAGEVLEVLMASIEKAKFRKPVVPGDVLRITAELIRDRKTIYSFHCEAFVDDEMVAEADILAFATARKI